MDCGRDDETVGGYVSRIESLCFESIIIDWPFENSVIVIIPVVNVENTVIVMVEWVGSIATIESLDKVVNTVVVVVKIVEVANSVVIVVVFVGFFNEEIVGCHHCFNSG